MRVIRTILALWLALGLTLSPVAADWARAHMVKCHHAQMMADGQMAPDEQVQSSKQVDCACCKGTAKCPPSFCAAKCASGQALLAADVGLPTPMRSVVCATPWAMTFWPSPPPDPPPPRA